MSRNFTTCIDITHAQAYFQVELHNHFGGNEMISIKNKDVKIDHYLRMVEEALRWPTQTNTIFEKATPEIVARISLDLFVAYKEMPRTYHGVAHPLNQNRALHLLYGKHKKLPGVNKSALIFMELFHDVIMLPGKSLGHNERASADYASKVLDQLGAPQDIESMVWAGVYATHDHSLEKVPENMHPTVGLMIDLDLMGLGGSPKNLRADTESIYLEYKDQYTREEYDLGRKAWATEFLKREKIYQTPYFAHLERQARSNLEALSEA